MVIILKTVRGLLTSLFGFYYLTDAYKSRKGFSSTPWPGLMATGFVTNTLDALGIGSFAQQTAIFKFFKMVDDRVIPGTMNVGNTIPTVTQAFIFMGFVPVQPLTLASMSIAAPAGAVLGAGVVSRMPRRKIQLGMGFGLLAVAMIILADRLLRVLSGEGPSCRAQHCGRPVHLRSELASCAIMRPNMLSLAPNARNDDNAYTTRVGRSAVR